MNFDEIRNYWEGRAAGDSTAQSTTQDIFLRQLELNVLIERLKKFPVKKVADIGSGDGRTTMGLAKIFNDIEFYGYDYSASMVENSRLELFKSGLKGVNFEVLDIMDGLNQNFDAVFSTRCLINLPTWDLQKKAIKNIHDCLLPNGLYLMIENFIEGQENFNKIRAQFGLSEIPMRDHNYFFRRDQLLSYVDDFFDVVEDLNISSMYYLVSRVIYSKICLDSGVAPDYFNEHHRYGTDLPFSGEYGPIRLIIFKKK